MLSNLLNQLNMTSGNVYNHIECVVAKYYKHSERSSAEVKGGGLHLFESYHSCEHLSDFLRIEKHKTRRCVLLFSL